MESYKAKKLKSSSLYESVIAISVIAIVISLSVIIFSNVTNGKGKKTYLEMINRVDSLMLVSDTYDITKKNVTYFKGYKISEQIELINGMTIFRIDVFEKNRNILTKRLIVKNNEKESAY